MNELYKGIEGSPITYLAADISANQTTISIADDSALPDAPNIATIGFGENIETIKYEVKSNGVLQNVTRGIEGTPQAWQAGTEVARFFTAYDHNSIIENFNTHLADYANDKSNNMISDSGGNLTDGYWTKFGDGTLLMTKHVRGEDGSSIISGNVTLPHPFTSDALSRQASYSIGGILEVSTGTWSVANRRVIDRFQIVGRDADTCNLRAEISSGVMSGRQLIITIQVIGRWKE